MPPRRRSRRTGRASCPTGCVVKRFAQQRVRGGVLHRRRLNEALTRRLRRAPYAVTIVVSDGARTITSTLRATRF